MAYAQLDEVEPASHRAHVVHVDEENRAVAVGHDLADASLVGGLVSGRVVEDSRA